MPKFYVLMEWYALDYRPLKPAIIYQLLPIGDIRLGPDFTCRDMIEGCDNASSTCLTNLFQRDRVSWAKPSPRFLHAVTPYLVYAW